ncbi:uncharacterized protein LOC114967602 [Acropora millepora]|uniref:uncharacterized protein LOC114967602 n=1 Tax=Acropora millepora TaxID=45264 RepID=UPI001CF23508|nr:uncharacterized protein LOC114967602 [Acropora millepora]
MKTTSKVCGFKAPSPLLRLPSFDIVSDVGIDSMHCVFLGVVKQLLGLWFDSKHSGQRWYCGNIFEKVDKRLLEIKPPSVITRIPRSIQHHLKFWKATEYRNWLLYYSLPCLKGILDEEYHQHYALLVGAITFLSGRSISPEQLEIARKFLMHFVEMYDAHYGCRYVLMNQHLLLHLAKSVNDHGPLWSSSLFVFEDWNGDIGNYFHGTQNVANQIMTAVRSHQCLPQLINELPPGCAKDLVLQLRGQTSKTNRTHLKEDFYAVGALTKGRATNTGYEDDLISILGVESLSDITFFSRLQIGEAVVHSKSYKRVTRRNNYTITYQKEESICYGQIEVFFVVRDDARMVCGAVLSSMAVSSKQVCKSHMILGSPVSHIVCLRQPNRNRFTVVPLEDIIDVCVYMKFSDCDLGYAAVFPNHIERD